MTKDNSTKFLFIIDMQNDFVTGSLGTKEAVNIIPNLEKLISDYYQHGYKIIFTQDTHNETYSNSQEGENLPIKHCIKGTKGWKIVDRLTNAAKNYTTIEKSTFGYPFWKELYNNNVCFTVNELEALKQGNAQIDVAGVCTDICVISNASILKAMFPEVPITLHSDCCAATTPEKHISALDIAESIQIKVV